MAEPAPPPLKLGRACRPPATAAPPPPRLPPPIKGLLRASPHHRKHHRRRQLPPRPCSAAATHASARRRRPSWPGRHVPPPLEVRGGITSPRRAHRFAPALGRPSALGCRRRVPPPPIPPSSVSCGVRRKKMAFLPKKKPYPFLISLREPPPL